MEAMTFGLVVVVVSLVVAVLIGTSQNANEEREKKERWGGVMSEVDKLAKLLEAERKVEDSHKNIWNIVPADILGDKKMYYVFYGENVLLKSKFFHTSLSSYAYSIGLSELRTMHYAKFEYEEAVEEIESFLKRESYNKEREDVLKEFLYQPPIEYTPYSATTPLDRQ